MRKKICALSMMALLSGGLGVATADEGFSFPEPQGNYSVGYQDYHWVNSSVCPDPYHTAYNDNDFSPGNTGFCREMVARVYYPSLAPKLANTPYDVNIIKQYQLNMLEFLPRMPRDILVSLNAVMSWDTAGAPAVKQTFPVIIFGPGYDVNLDQYTVIIDSLVSQGYIVVALSNTFLSSSVILPDGHTVFNHFPTARRTPVTTTAVEGDINFVMKQVVALHNSDPLFAEMNLNEIGVMGHSMGADMAMFVGHSDSSQVKAVLALDPYDEKSMGLTLHYNFNLPFMVIHADNWFCQDQHAPTAHINQNAYFIVMDHMQHLNFSDLSLLQYQDAFSYAITNSPAYRQALYGAQNNVLGSTNGNEAMTIQNAYISQFFNHYLKGDPLGWLGQPGNDFPGTTKYIGSVTVPLPNSWPGAECPDE